MKMLLKNSSIFFQFLRRDAYIFNKRIKSYLFNYCLLYPFLYVMCFGYLVPIVSGQEAQTTVLFVGCLALIMQILGFITNVDLIFDFEEDRFVEYQTSILYPPLAIIKRILFSTIFCFVLIIPFYPLSKLLLQTRLDLSHTNWTFLYIHLLISCIFCCALNIFGLCAVKNSQRLENLWVRFYHPMFMMGGFQVPMYAMQNIHPFFKYVLYCNPMIYITEGIRNIIIGGPNFICFYKCDMALLISTVIFTLGALYFFKKKLDHI